MSRLESVGVTYEMGNNHPDIVRNGSHLDLGLGKVSGMMCAICDSDVARNPATGRLECVCSRRDHGGD